MPLTFNAGSSGFDWKAALSALLEARATKSEKTVEQNAPEKTKAPKPKAEPAIQIDISEPAKKGDAAVADTKTATKAIAKPVVETVASAAAMPTETSAPAASKMSPAEATPTPAAAPLSTANRSGDAALAEAGRAAAKVANLTGLDAAAAARPAPQDAAEAPEASDIDAARAAAIRRLELDRMESVVSSIASPSGSAPSIAPIEVQGAARAGAAYGASAAAPAPAGERTDIAA